MQGVVICRTCAVGKVHVAGLGRARLLPSRSVPYRARPARREPRPGLMKTTPAVSSAFCCAAKGRFTLGGQRHAQGLGHPVPHVGCAAGLHRFSHRCGGGVDQHGAKAQQQLGEPASRLLFFQLLELPETRLQDFAAAGEASPGRACDSCNRTNLSSSAASCLALALRGPSCQNCFASTPAEPR